MDAPKGYPLKWFKDQQHVREMYQCVVCEEVIKIPVQVSGCGHRFCECCFSKAVRYVFSYSFTEI